MALPVADLRFVETDTLLMEFVKLPVSDLNLRFLYRFIEPIGTTVWTEGSISILSIMQQAGAKTEEQWLEEFALREWHKMLEPMTSDINTLPLEQQSVFDAKKARTIECVITRKNELYIPLEPLKPQEIK